MRVGKPATYRNGVLRVEDVRRGRIVDDDGFSKVASNLGEILMQMRPKGVLELIHHAYLDVVALMVVAAFSEQPMVHNIMYIKLIKEWIAVLSADRSANALHKQKVKGSYLCNRSGKDDNLVELSDALHKLVHSRPLDDVNVVILTLDFDRYREVRLMKDLEESTSKL